MNSAAVKLLGYDATLETVFLPNLVPASEKDKVATGFRNLIKTGNITDFKITIVTKEQKNCLVHINASVICDENGNIVAAQGIVRDITSEEKKAQIIKEQKRQLEFIVNSSPLGIALTTNGLIDHCNASFTRILGYSEEYK